MTIAEALNISAVEERVWQVDDTLYVYTPRRAESFTSESLTRQRILSEPPYCSGNFMRMGRLVYLTAGWAKKNAELFKV